MMRVLHVVRSLRPETGGVATAVHALVKAQVRRGDRVSVLSLDPADASSDSDDIAVEAVGRSSYGYGYALAFVSRMRDAASNGDVVVVHGLWQYHALGAWRALKGGRVPYVVYPHGMLDVWFKRAYPLKHAKKWLYWPWADYRVLRDASAVLYTAENERLRARQSFWLYRAQERVAPIGIDDPAITPSAANADFFVTYPQLRGRPFLLFLGRIHPKKGIDLLIDGYAATISKTDVAPVLAIAGPCDDERYRQSLIERVRERCVEFSVVWLPMLVGDEKRAALEVCEAFVLFSHQENFAVAVVEALAFGKPVLISDQIAIWREIVDDGAGIAVPDTVEGVARAIAAWAAMSDTQRAAMQQAARDCFEQRFTADQAAAALDAVVAEVTSHR